LYLDPATPTLVDLPVANTVLLGDGSGTSLLTSSRWTGLGVDQLLLQPIPTNPHTAAATMISNALVKCTTESSGNSQLFPPLFTLVGNASLVIHSVTFAN
jgi:hypothetical protein